MRGDPLTKQLPAREYMGHLGRSLQMYPRGTVGRRCDCYRCEGPDVCVKSRCENIITSSDTNETRCDECKEHGGEVSPRQYRGGSRSSETRVEPEYSFSCACTCRGATILLCKATGSLASWGKWNRVFGPYQAYLPLNREGLAPYWRWAGEHLTLEQERAELELSSLLYVSIGTILLITMIMISFQTWAWWKYVRICSGNGDEKMPPQGRGGPGQGGGGKRHQGGEEDDQDNDDIESIINGLQDLRTDEEREKDIRRRLAGQCVYVGWFRCKKGPPAEAPTNPGGKYVFRRCQKQNTGDMPWCRHHMNWTNQSPDADPTPKPKPPKDPDDKKDKEKRNPRPFPKFMYGLLGTGEIAGTRSPGR